MHDEPSETSFFEDVRCMCMESVLHIKFISLVRVELYSACETNSIKAFVAGQGAVSSQTLTSSQGSLPIGAEN